MPEKFNSDLGLDAGMHKTDAHPCLPKAHGYEWAWAWAWAPNVGLCYIHTTSILKTSENTYLQSRSRHPHTLPILQANIAIELIPHKRYCTQTS
jgi:hypothetical protein